MKIIDAFLFFNEHKLLELRQQELHDVVDYFIPLISTHTFTNIPITKDYNYLKYESKLDPNPWVNETNQRNYLKNVVDIVMLENHLDPNDTLVLFSDCDEIPNVESIEFLKERPQLAYFQMIPHYYGINCRSNEPFWPGGFAIPYNQINRTIEEYRKNRHFGPFIKGGWHYSYCMGTEGIKQKIESFSHQEYNSDYYTNKSRLEKIISEGKDLFDRDIQYYKLEIDDTFPRSVRDNPEYWECLMI